MFDGADRFAGAVDTRTDARTIVRRSVRCRSGGFGRRRLGGSAGLVSPATVLVGPQEARPPDPRQTNIEGLTPPACHTV